MTRYDPSSVCKKASARETRMEAFPKGWREAGKTPLQGAASDRKILPTLRGTQIMISLAQRLETKSVVSDGIAC
jgi:hypothetical protein